MVNFERWSTAAILNFQMAAISTHFSTKNSGCEHRMKLFLVAKPRFSMVMSLKKTSFSGYHEPRRGGGGGGGLKDVPIWKSTES